jgi:gluconokinase
MAYIIGCDIGTTNVKTVAFTTQGNLLGSTSKGYPMHHPEPDRSEQNPNEIMEAVFTTIQQLVISCKDYGEVLGISFSSAMHSVLVVDSKARPITPLLIWADNRSSAIADELRKSEFGMQIYHQNGTPIHAMAPVCKLCWLKQHQAQLFTNDHKFIGIKEYVIARLTGKFLIDYSIASATGLFDIRKFRWNQETLDYIGISAEQLSVPVSPYHQEVLPPTNPLNLPAGTPLIMGASDGCLANLGSGAISPGTMAVTIGTSAAARICSPTAYTDKQMRTFCYLLDENMYVIGGATNSGGAVFEWMKKTLYPDVSYDQLFEEIQTIDPGADALFFLPYLLGERAPLWSSTVRGGFLGLDIQHTRAHMARAVVEGILLNLFTLVKTVRDKQPITTCYANGGFAQSPVAMQLLSTIFGMKVYLNETVETSALGAALMGLKSLGFVSPQAEIETLKAVNQYITPDLATHQHYAQISDNFEQLVGRITRYS